MTKKERLRYFLISMAIAALVTVIIVLIYIRSKANYEFTPQESVEFSGVEEKEITP